MFLVLQVRRCRRRTAFAALAAANLALLLCPIAARAQATIGSATIDRTNIDTASGVTTIYGGGSFLPSVQVTTLTLFRNTGGATQVTPLLFEETAPDVFTLRGIGTARTATASASPQSVAFGLAGGTDTTTNSNFTFGLIFALVGASGTISGSGSTGTAEFDTTSTGTGVSPGSANQWLFTQGISVTPSLPLGSTFGRPGSGATFALNPANGTGFAADRTYSANLSSTAVTVVPEASTAALLVLPILVTAATILQRRRVAS